VVVLSRLRTSRFRAESIRSVSRIDGLQSAVLHHGRQHAGVEKFGLFDEAINHGLCSRLHLALDERDERDVASDLDIFSEVQSIGWSSNPQLPCLNWLAGLIAAYAPFVPHINSCWSIDVCLKAPRHVVEAAVEANLSGSKSAHARHILDLFRDLVPCRVELVCFRISGGLDRLVVEDERVDSNQFAMAVEDVDTQLAGNVDRDRRDLGVDLFLSQHIGWRWMLLRLKIRGTQGTMKSGTVESHKLAFKLVTKKFGRGA
jgi:hypothetical protein